LNELWCDHCHAQEAACEHDKVVDPLLIPVGANSHRELFFEIIQDHQLPFFVLGFQNLGCKLVHAARHHASRVVNGPVDPIRLVFLLAPQIQEKNLRHPTIQELHELLCLYALEDLLSLKAGRGEGRLISSLVDTSSGVGLGCYMRVPRVLALRELGGRGSGS